MEYAPVALFVYNRPWHTKKTVEALLRNKHALESCLYIFSDGPKNEIDKESVNIVRQYIRSIKGFKNIEINERPFNYGLAKSIISGVSEIISKHSKIIVLEDDLVTSPYFLEFMNDGLNYYEKNNTVISIHGYLYPIKGEIPKTFFIKGADCWGWATWERGWKLFNSNAESLFREIKEKKLSTIFNYNNSYPNMKMLKDNMKGKNDSWAIRWHASAIINNKLTLYPGESLVNNIGGDSSGTNMKLATSVFQVEICNSPIELKPIPVEENYVIRKKIASYHRKLLLNLIYNKLKYYLYVKK